MAGLDLTALIGPGGPAAALAALVQVLLIDLVLAGDNAVAVGIAAAGLDRHNRRRVIFAGLSAAVALRIGFALIATQLLALIGLLLAGGVLLLWVCWKMWRELREQAAEAWGEAALQEAVGGAVDADPGRGGRRRFRNAFLQILAADVSMSLDNVLAVAGAARQHPAVLVVGLLASIVLVGVAASWIARLLHRHRWIGFIGLAIVLYVALHMIWQGHRQVVVDLGHTAEYNAMMPDPLKITPQEAASR
jgi:YjbE family integral membrane protein